MRVPFVAKNNRSPTCNDSRLAGTDVPTFTCCRDVRGSSTPCCRNTYCTKPEQSNPLGVSPPQTYLVPTYSSAVASTRPAVAELLRREVAVLPRSSSHHSSLPRELTLAATAMPATVARSMGRPSEKSTLI